MPILKWRGDAVRPSVVMRAWRLFFSGTAALWRPKERVPTVLDRIGAVGGPLLAERPAAADGSPRPTGIPNSSE
jgi:hypothetical protein